jgi:uncharacterized protein with HEPN domain
MSKRFKRLKPLLINLIDTISKIEMYIEDKTYEDLVDTAMLLIQ